MIGLSWKRNLEVVLERHRRFFRREMQDGILASLPVKLNTEAQWAGFEKKWKAYPESDPRPFPCNEEIFEREIIGLEERGAVEDDNLPVVYSILDAGESMVGAMFGQDVHYFHRPRAPAYSGAEPVLSDYKDLANLRFSLENAWARRFLAIQDYFSEHAEGRFAQHPCLTMDALNFAAEIRGATQAYLDIYEHPEELKVLMETGLDFNIRFQEAQARRTGTYAGGSFNWLGGWVPFPGSVSLSVDAYVICSVRNYVELGFDYQRRLIEHFGHGLLHFHCNRADLASEAAKLPNLALFQFGGDTRDPLSELERLPEMRRAVGDIPIMLNCARGEFQARLAAHKLLPNVWYNVVAADESDYFSIDAANRLMEKVRAY